MKKCPLCAEEIQDEAIKCRFCGEFLDKDNFNKTNKPLFTNGVIEPIQTLSQGGNSGMDSKKITDNKKKQGYLGCSIALVVLVLLIMLGSYYSYQKTLKKYDEDVKKAERINKGELNKDEQKKRADEQKVKEACALAIDLGNEKGKIDRMDGVYDKHAAKDFYNLSRQSGFELDTSTYIQMCFEQGYEGGYYNRLLR